MTSERENVQTQKSPNYSDRKVRFLEYIESWKDVIENKQNHGKMILKKLGMGESCGWT